MNWLTRRLRGMLEPQAPQALTLALRTHLDIVTGLPNRRHFMAQLESALQGVRPGGAGLLIARLRQLDAMNQRLGLDATDRLLAAVAKVLQAYPRHVKGALAGRLNATDFALYLPAAAMAEETARSLLGALRAALATVDPGADMAIGGVDMPHATEASAALTMADGALAQAEGSGPFALEVVCALQAAQGLAMGEGQWQARLAHALQSGGFALAEREVLDRDGALLHLACALGLRLDDDGPFEPPARWLAMAVRCRLIARLDLAALTLALEGVRRDGVARAVNLSAASLASHGFIGQVRQHLEATPPQCAARLSIDLGAGAALQPTKVAEASKAWRCLGVRLGLVHAGRDLHAPSCLPALGVDHVRIDGDALQGVATDAAVHERARRLVTQLRGMGLNVMATAVHDPADLAALWALGLDGAIG